MHTVDSHIIRIMNDTSGTGFKTQARTYINNLIVSACPDDINQHTRNDILEVQALVDRLCSEGMTNITTSIEAVHCRTDSKLATLDSHLSELLLCRLADVRIAAAIVSADDTNTSTAHREHSPPMEGFVSHWQLIRNSTPLPQPPNRDQPSMFTPEIATESTVCAMSTSDRQKHYMAHQYNKDLH